MCSLLLFPLFFKAFAKEVLRRCIGGTPEEMPEEYERRSALCWAGDIHVPVLLIHSRQDPRANFETQAERIYETLNESTDCTFITYDDDVHGLHYEDIPIITAWLDHS